MNNIISKRFINMNQFTVQGQQIRPVIERGASWSYNETRILLSLWGQDMVQRQLTNSKRTRHVWEKIAEKIKEHGFDRTADQVRTRVFNMIAEYRRILKNPTPEKKKKCAFFDALKKIYQAKDTNGVKAALDNYEEEYNFDPIEFNNLDEDLMIDNEIGMENSENSENEDKEIFSYALSPSHFKSYNLNYQNGNLNGNLNKDLNNNHSLNSSTSNGFSNHNNLMYAYSNYINSQQNSQNNSIDNGEVSDNHSDDNMLNENNSSKKIKFNDDFNLNFKKKKTLYNQEFNSDKFNSQNELDLESAAILIDRMFNHLTKETEVMREWIKLERERLHQEMIRRREDNLREERREKKFLETLVKMQEQMFNFLSKNSSNINPSLDFNSNLNLNLDSNSNSNTKSNFNTNLNSTQVQTSNLNTNSTSNSTSTFSSTSTSTLKAPSTSISTANNSSPISINIKKNLTTIPNIVQNDNNLTENLNDPLSYRLPLIASQETSGHSCLSLKYNQNNMKNEDPLNSIEYVIEEQVVEDEDEEREINYSYSNVQYEEIVD